jgi:hypothetical protein
MHMHGQASSMAMVRGGSQFVFVFGIILLGRPSCRRHPHPHPHPSLSSWMMHGCICMPFRFPKLTLWGCSKAARVKGNLT